MASLTNLKTGQLEDIPQDKISSSLESGTHDLPKGSTLQVVNPEGELVHLPSEDIYDAINKYGYKIPSSSDVEEFQNEQKYGEGLGNTLKAAALGAARGATFGTSDYLVNAEEAKQLEQRHPIASGAGEFLGVGATALAAPELSPVGLVGEAGSAIEAALSPETGKLAQLGAKAVGAAAEGAAYGAGKSVSEHALGDPDLNGEKILSNIGYGAVFGGAIGGALGAAEVALPKSYNAAKDAISKLYDVAIGQPGEEAGVLSKAFAKTSSFVSGKDYHEILDAFQDRMRTLTELKDQQKVLSDFSGGLQKQYETIKKAVASVYDKIKPEEINKALELMPRDVAMTEASKVHSMIDETIADMEARPRLYKDYAIETLKDLKDDFSKQITEESKSADIFNKINEFKKNLANQNQLFRRADTIPLDTMPTVNRLKGLYNGIKTGLEDSDVWGEAATRQSAFNDAYAEWKQLTNEQGSKKGDFVKLLMSPTSRGGQGYRIDPSKVMSLYRNTGNIKGELGHGILGDYLGASEKLLKQIEETYKSVPSEAFNKDEIQGLIEKNRDFTTKAVEQAEYNKTLSHLGGGAHNVQFGEMGAASIGMLGHPAVGAALEAWSMAKAPNVLIRRLAQVESVVQKTTNSIEKGASSLFKAGSTLGEPFIGITSKKMLDADEHEKEANKLTAMTAAPEKLIDAMNESTKDLHPYAPSISQGLNAAQARAVSFLSSKVPRGTNQNYPLSPKYVPSTAEISQFNRYKEAVNDPIGLLKEIKVGGVSQEGMEVLQTVYPKLYGEMKQKIMDKLTDHMAKKESHIPFTVKQGLSTFLQVDLDSSLSQNTIAANQLMLQGMQAKADAENQPIEPINKSTANNIGKSTLANRTQTPMQASSVRETA